MLLGLQSTSRRSWILITMGTILLYFLGGILIRLPLESTTTFLFWPPAGFAFAAFWWFGARAATGVIIGSLLVSFLIAGDTHISSIAPIAALVSTEAWLPVWWLKRQGIQDIFMDTEAILKFIASAALVAPAGAATMGALILWLNNVVPYSAIPQATLSWWVGDSMGVLLITPFLLALPQWGQAFSVRSSRILELGVITGCLGWLWHSLFANIQTHNLPPHVFLAVPFIIWVAVRFRITILTLALCILSVSAVLATALGYGPFVQAELGISIAYLYGFLGVLIAIGLFLCVAVSHNRRNMENLARKHLELQASEEGLCKTLESTPNVAVQWFNRQGRVLYWNNASETLYGWKPEEAMGKTLDQLIYSPEAAAHFSNILEALVHSDSMVGPIESSVQHRNGRIGNIVSTIFAMPEADGEPRRFVCIDVDITKIKEAEDALAASHAHLCEAQRIAKLGSWKWDIVNDIFTGSEESYRIFGIDPETPIKFKDICQFVHPDDRELFLASVARDFTYPNQESTLEFRIVQPSGNTRSVFSQTRVLYNTHQEATHGMGTIQDITERKAFEVALQLARDEAIEANLAKSEFLSSISHELRTPLNGILGYSQLFEMDASLSSEYREYAGEITQAGKHLLSLINDLIDLSRIETGNIVMSIRPIPLQEAIISCLQSVTHMAQLQQVALINCINTEKILWVEADAVRLRQVLFNLLSNAIKYNRPGGTVTLSCQQDDNMLFLNVMDTGMGIPADLQPRVFHAFDRLGRESGPIAGTGIGLVISHRIVTAMGGTMGFQSEEGKGSAFWVRLPQTTFDKTSHETNASIPKNPAPKLPDIRKPVLYIEDNPVNVRLMQLIFAKHSNIDFRDAETAEQGLLLARSQPPALILMDINLPGMNGYEALKQFRSDPRTAEIPIIAVTANAMKGDEKLAMDAGFDSYITKPINVTELLEIVSGALSQTPVG